MRNAPLLRFALVTLTAAGVWLAWSQNPPAQLTMEKVTGNLYVIMQDGGNVAVMPTSEGVVVVDDKFAQDAPQIMAKIKTVSDKPVRYVINTHQHGDHTGGNEAMLAAGAEILIQRNARANMVTGKQPGLPRITFSDETQVFLGGKEVRARHLGRGHTNGDAVVYFPSERAIHTGDLFVSSGAPFCDTANGGSIQEWERHRREDPGELRFRYRHSGPWQRGQTRRFAEVGHHPCHHPHSREDRLRRRRGRRRKPLESDRSGHDQSRNVGPRNARHVPGVAVSQSLLEAGVACYRY